jgi:hypothetical protein
MVETDQRCRRKPFAANNLTPFPIKVRISQFRAMVLIVQEDRHFQSVGIGAKRRGIRCEKA